MAIRKKKCSYQNCSSNSKDDSELRFFNFPKKLYLEWIAASGNEKLKSLSLICLRTHRYICAKHFHRSDFARPLSPFKAKSWLNEGAIPQKYVDILKSDEGGGQPDVEEPTGCEDLEQCSEEDSKLPKKTKKRLKKCAFVNCANDSRSHPEMKFYLFPHSNYKEWIAASGCPELNTLTKINLCSNYYVCSNHFRLTDCKKILLPSKKRFPLKSGVVPLLFRHENSRIKVEESDVQSSPKKCKTLQPASKSSKTSQPSTTETSSICLPIQTAAESTSHVSQSSTNTSFQTSSQQHGDDSSTSNSAGLFLRDVKRKDSEETLSNLKPDQTQGTALCPIQEPNNNKNCIRSLQFSAPKKPPLTPSLSQVDYEKSYSNIAIGFDDDDDDDEFSGCEETFFENIADDEENQMCIDNNSDRTDNRAIERRTDFCSKQGSESEASSKTKVQMHQGSEFEPDDQEVVSDVSKNVCNENCSSVPNPSLCNKEGTSNSQSTEVIEDKSVNFKDSAVEGCILSSTSSGGAVGEGGSEKLDIVATAAAMAGVTTSSVVPVSTPIITAGRGCTTVAKISTGSSLLSASPITTGAQLCLRLPKEQTIPVKVPIAALMSASTMPSPSPLCLPPPVQQVVELPQQGTSKLSVADVSPASDPLTGHQPGPSPAASGSNAPEGPTNDCSSEPLKGKKRKKCVVASPSEDDQERKKMKALERKRAVAEKRRRSRQEKREMDSKLESEVALLKAEVTSLKDLLLLHMACPAPLAPTVKGANPVVTANPFVVTSANPFVVAAANPVVVAAANPVVVAANRPKVAAANLVVVAAEGPKVAAANPGVVAAEGPKVAAANLVLVAAEEPKVAAANPGVVAAKGPKVAAANLVVVAAEGPKVAAANPVVVAAEGRKVAAANPVVVAAEGPKVAAANPVVVAAERPKVAAANPVVVAAEGPKFAAANPVVGAAEGPKVAAVPAVRPGQSSDAERQLKPRGRTILPSTSKPAPATFLLFTMQRKAAT